MKRLAALLAAAIVSTAAFAFAQQQVAQPIPRRTAPIMTPNCAPSSAKKGGETVGDPVNTEQRRWQPRDFRLAPAPAEQQKLDGLSVKQSIQRDGIGEARDYNAEPSQQQRPRRAANPASRGLRALPAAR